MKDSSSSVPLIVVVMVITTTTLVASPMSPSLVWVVSLLVAKVLLVHSLVHGLHESVGTLELGLGQYGVGVGLLTTWLTCYLVKGREQGCQLAVLTMSLSIGCFNLTLVV